MAKTTQLMLFSPETMSGSSFLWAFLRCLHARYEGILEIVTYRLYGVYRILLSLMDDREAPTPNMLQLYRVDKARKQRVL